MHSDQLERALDELRQRVGDDAPPPPAFLNAVAGRRRRQTVVRVAFSFGLAAAACVAILLLVKVPPLEPGPSASPILADSRPTIGWLMSLNEFGASPELILPESVPLPAGSTPVLRAGTRLDPSLLGS